MKGIGTNFPVSKGCFSEVYCLIQSTTSKIIPNLIPKYHLRHKPVLFLSINYLANSRPWLRLIHSLMTSLVTAHIKEILQFCY